MRSFPLSVAASLAIVLVANVATADDKTAAAHAAALFEEGRRLMVAEDYAAACPKLAESQTLDPLPDTAFDLGLCYQMASQAAFKMAHELVRPPEPTPLAVPAAASGPSEANTSGVGQTQRAVGLTIGGTGVAGIVAGIVTGLMARTAYDQLHSCAPHCSGSQVTSYRELATASTISALTGAAAMGAGLIVFFTAAKSTPGAGTTVGLGPTAGGAGLSVTGAF